jgi:hypothetical protein
VLTGSAVVTANGSDDGSSESSADESADGLMDGLVASSADYLKLMV